MACLITVKPFLENAPKAAGEWTGVNLVKESVVSKETVDLSLSLLSQGHQQDKCLTGMSLYVQAFLAFG